MPLTLCKPIDTSILFINSILYHDIPFVSPRMWEMYCIRTNTIWLTITIQSFCHLTRDLAASVLHCWTKHMFLQNTALLFCISLCHHYYTFGKILWSEWNNQYFNEADTCLRGKETGGCVLWLCSKLDQWVDWMVRTMGVIHDKRRMTIFPQLYPTRSLFVPSKCSIRITTP